MNVPINTERLMREMARRGRAALTPPVQRRSAHRR